MKSVFATLLVFIALSTFCFSKTIHVPGDYSTIYYAVWIAEEGDEIIVAPGTYVENIVFRGKDIILRSSDGPEVTVIDGKNSSPYYRGSVVAFEYGESADCVLEGFTLINGKGTAISPGQSSYGGGVLCSPGFPTLKNLIITENYATNGGGIYCSTSSNPTLIDIVITNNSAYLSGYSTKGSGGGIYCQNGMTNISNLYICGNKATFGGGIACSSSSITIANNTICENSATEVGGGIWCGYGTTTITDNTICDNSATEEGGGIWCGQGNLTITNNTISSNTADYGGGIYNVSATSSYGSHTTTIRNNTINMNSVVQDGGGIWLDCGDNSMLSSNIINDNASDSEGGGIYWQNCSPFLKNNTIIGNSSAYRGGGLFCKETTSGLSNNIISGNSSKYGGGVYCYMSDSFRISGSTIADNFAESMGGGLSLIVVADTAVTNTILWNNSSPNGPEICVGDSVTASALFIEYSDLEGGQGSVLVNPESTLYWGDGMIDSDPLFVGPALRDYHLKQEPCHPGEHSPCVDTGDPDALFGGTTRADSELDIFPVDMGYHHPPDGPRVLYVPAEHASIQTAINATWDGDLVIVSPGTYVENIDFKGNAIYVRSSGGATTTVIDGGAPADPEQGSVVTFSMGECNDSVLEGFTLKSGTGNLMKLNLQESHYYGGGICCINSSPYLKNNAVVENTADYGGGLHCYHANPFVKSNTIHGNSGVFEGGGICSFDSSPILAYNTISENSVTSGPGGGIGCTKGATTAIVGNVISDNTARTGGGINLLQGCDATVMENYISGNSAIDYGGGIFMDNCRPDVTNNSVSNNSAQYGGGCAILDSSYFTFANNLFSENYASQRGGGGYFVESNIYEFQNNIISNNMANAGGGISFSASDIRSINNTIWGNSAVNGGGLYLVNGAKPQFTNTILSKNTAAQGSEIELRGGFNPPQLTISYSVVEGGAPMVYLDPDCSFILGDGVIVSDPLLVDPENGDFHLAYSSPCRDTGDNTVQYLPQADFEVDPRISQDFTDMGADEFHPHLYCTGDFTPGGEIKGKFVGVPDTYPVGLFIGSGVIDPPLHHMWGDFYLEAPWLFVPLVPIPSDGVLVIPTALPGAPAGPYDIPMQALIGSTLTNLFVLEVW